MSETAYKISMDMFDPPTISNTNKFLDDCNNCIEAIELARKFANKHQKELPGSLDILLDECLDYTILVKKFVKQKSEFSTILGSVAIAIWEKCKIELNSLPNPIIDFAIIPDVCDLCIISCHAELNI